MKYQKKHTSSYIPIIHIPLKNLEILLYIYMYLYIYMSWIIVNSKLYPTWLVVSTPLKNMLVSWDDEITN
jgi:hypothetical protein